MIMLAIVFGLSMDYKVFFLTRICEVWKRTGDKFLDKLDGLFTPGAEAGH